MLIGQVVVRKANMNDARRAYIWRNAEITRRYSRNPSALTLEEHLDWWRTKIDESSNHLLIAHCNSVGVGVIRFDLTGNQAEISIYIDPDLHGFGLGSRLLELGCGWLVVHEPNVNRLVAEIHAENGPSIKTFRAFGFSIKAGSVWQMEIRR
jgi:RimJ/RimL family protein N-acetyltransferase